jgi:hypothetical protein
VLVLFGDEVEIKSYPEALLSKLYSLLLVLFDDEVEAKSYPEAL